MADKIKVQPEAQNRFLFDLCQRYFTIPFPPSLPEKFDFKGLTEYLLNNLPPYGVPIFLRLKTKLATTSTYKLQKTVLKKEGINLNLIDDALFVKLPYESNYIPFTKEIYIDIQNEKIKL